MTRLRTNDPQVCLLSDKVFNADRAMTGLVSLSDSWIHPPARRLHTPLNDQTQGGARVVIPDETWRHLGDKRHRNTGR